MIKEREDGSLADSYDALLYTAILLSKIWVYLGICMLQFALILIMGVIFSISGYPRWR
jgi:hypothetical protein